MGTILLLLTYVYHPVFTIGSSISDCYPALVFLYNYLCFCFCFQSQQKEETQSFAQKLQLKVPSMESLIRSGASRAENLFRSPSKDSLVRSSSRDSLTPLAENDSAGAPTYDPPSDIESEAEEPPGGAETLSKEQLMHRLMRVESSLGKYRGKYSEVGAAVFRKRYSTRRPDVK